MRNHYLTLAEKVIPPIFLGKEEIKQCRTIKVFSMVKKRVYPDSTIIRECCQINLSNGRNSKEIVECYSF